MDSNWEAETKPKFNHLIEKLFILTFPAPFFSPFSWFSEFWRTNIKFLFNGNHIS